jgi:ABC-type branched-subunit amino acid transport system ATPase component/ABC-type branched-subunit amino acid transport system permease subunit
MTDLARDLYLLVAVAGLLPAVRWAGLPVLAASAFAAIGGVGALQLERAGLPIGGAILLAVVGGGAAGALTGALLLRAAPPFVALATWALAWLGYTVLLGFPALSGGTQGLTRPALDTVETPLGFSVALTPRVHVVAAAVLCVLAYVAARRFPAHDAAAARDDHELAAVLRIPSRRVEALALSGATAAAAGAGTAVLLGVAAPADVAPLLALQLFAATLAATRNLALGVVVIAALPHAANWLTAVLLLAAVAVRERAPRDDAEPSPPAALVARWRRQRAGVARGDIAARAGETAPRSAGGVAAAGAGDGLPLPAARHAAPARRLATLAGRAPRELPAPEPPGELPPTSEALSVRELRVTLGGREILRGLDLEVAPGQIHALIGPNGSGKTTALRALEVTRTFQRDAGFPALTPYEQLALITEEPWTYLALTELTARAHAGDLTAAERRLLAVSLAAATEAPALAFDEPAAGLSHAERETLTHALRALAGAGRALLVVEHDLRLVAALADVVTVLDDGVAIAHGAPDAVIADATVQSVYLGVA